MRLNEGIDRKLFPHFLVDSCFYNGYGKQGI